MGPLLLSGALVAGLIACKVPIDAPIPAVDATSSSPSPSAPPGLVRFAAVGDSLTAGIVDPLTLTNPPGETSWVYYADEDESVEFVGGWAQAGSTSTLQAQNLTPVDSDVLIIMTGTNDVVLGIDFTQQAADMDAIAATIRAPDVLVLAIPPLDARAGSGIIPAINSQVAQLAARRGWDFVDPWGRYRAGEAWVAGTSTDGTHPTLAVHAEVGAFIAEYLDQIYGS